MVERERKGGLRVDPAVTEFQKKAALNTAALTRKQRRDRRRVVAKYDFPPEVKTAVEKIAAEESTSYSQVAALLLAYAICMYAQGDPEIVAVFQENREPARTPRFEWNIEIPETWTRVLEEFTADGTAKRFCKAY